MSASAAAVDLSALAANLAWVRELAPEAAVMLAVKADAYGHGAVAVSRFVENHRLADRLAVATVDEALELQAAGVTLPIMKLSPVTPGEADAATAADLVLPVGTVEDVAIVAATGRRVRVHLQVDTGMGRLGCRPDEAAAVAAAIDAAQNLELEGLFTHPPVADAVDDGGFTDRELDTFLALADQLQRARGPIRFVHASNSATLITRPRPWLTMVRPGIMAYGYPPDATNPHLDPQRRLRPVLSWTSALSHVKQVEAGTPIGYGSTWRASETTWIGTVPVGYADGFSRRLSNRGEVLIAGRRVPVVGRVCMDQFMVDLGPGNTPPATAGDRVTLIGRDGDQRITADDLASLLDTISYEVLCLIGSRVPRCPMEQTGEHH